jgi:arylsulfatase A-like enzyme
MPSSSRLIPAAVLLGLVLLLPSWADAQVAAQRPPNVVLILADDLGWADLGVYGSSFYETPNLDRLAAQGVRFTQAYANPVCSPTRAALLTGREAARIGITDWIPGRTNRPDQRLLQAPQLPHLPLEETTLAEMLGQAGYATAHIGKWHLGGPGFLPENQGFDHNVAGTQYGSPPGYFHPFEGRYSLPEVAEGSEPGDYLTDRLTDHGVRFIEQHRDRPFFLYQTYFVPHTPLQGPPDLVKKYERKADSLGVPTAGAPGSRGGNPAQLLEREPATRAVFGREGNHHVRTVQNHAVYAAMVEAMDRNVGRILQALEDAGIADETLVIFYSDNGGLATAEGWPTSNLTLRAGKGWLYEGGLRVPLLLRWPGVTVPGSTSDVPVREVDIFPTIATAAGVMPLAEMHIGGVDLRAVLQGASTVPERPLFWHYPHYSNQGGRPGGAVRLGDLKLVEFFEDRRLELYDLAADVGERHDLAAARRSDVERLHRLLNAWRAEVRAVVPGTNPEFRD